MSFIQMDFTTDAGCRRRPGYHGSQEYLVLE